MKPRTVTIVDFGMGNLLSVRNAFEYHDAIVNITSDPKDVAEAEVIVLPGVGAFPAAMKNLERLNLIDSIKSFASREQPLLAICLGMQLLMDSSDEFALTNGLGLIPGRVQKIPPTLEKFGEKTPRIGWREITIPDKQESWRGSILEECSNESSMYFVHSYRVLPKERQDFLAVSQINEFEVCSAIKRNNLTGVQFHPEKSGKNGLKLIKSFLKSN
jgi:glutamine amidotransferase